MRTKYLDRPCSVCRCESGNVLFTQSYIVPDNFPLSPENKNHIKKDIVSCNKCGFCFTDDSLSQSDYNDYYEKYAKHSHFSFPDKDTPIDDFNAYLIDVINKTCNRDTSKRIADIGCGSGKLLIGLKSKSFTKLHGIDIATSTEAYLEHYGIHYQQGSVTEINKVKKNSKPFDLVAIISVIEHVSDLHQSVSNASSILKDYGHILISVPDSSLYHKELLPNPLFSINLEHINHFDSISLCNLMAQHGYQQQFSEKFVLNNERFKGSQMIHIYQKVNITKTITNLPFAEGASQSIEKLASSWQKKPANEIISKLASTQEEIAIYGAGIYTFNMLADTELKNCNIISFIDENPNKQGKTLLDTPIRNPEFLLNFTGSIAISVANEPKSVFSTLRKMEIENKTYAL